MPRRLAFTAVGALLLLLCACVGSGILLGAAGTIVFNGLRLPLAASAPTSTLAATDTSAAVSTSTQALATTAPTATASASQGGGGNPWGYNFSCCHLIYSPPSSFCAYFACIPNFWNGSGYVVECYDSLLSKSGGLSGACSYHGGEWRPLYAPSSGGNPTPTPTICAKAASAGVVALPLAPGTPFPPTSTPTPRPTATPTTVPPTPTPPGGC